MIMINICTLKCLQRRTESGAERCVLIGQYFK